jgi:hypothetical protein
MNKIQITLNLETEEANEIAIRAAKLGITTGELLEAFIVDVVGDPDEVIPTTKEGKFANNYISYRWEGDNFPNFIESLFESGFYSTFYESMQLVELYKEKEAIEGLSIEEQYEMEAAEETIKVCYDAYKKTYKKKAQSLDQGLEAVRRFEKDRRNLLTDVECLREHHRAL